MRFILMRLNILLISFDACRLNMALNSSLNWTVCMLELSRTEWSTRRLRKD